MNGPVSKLSGCAIYTRKSTEHNLDLAFNSLDAQREACEAYIKSQAAEGWRLIPDHYDDGAFSGASLERPALQALLTDVRAHKVDVVVVYKVDRLTRSLADFAKLIELFEANDVSFVSVTQSFNTSSSMGRLTLNVLLSFAQFERELIGERVRDKIAAFIDAPDRDGVIFTKNASEGLNLVAHSLGSRLGPGDAIFSTHRCHGHFLASGGNLVAFLAELMGRSGGVCGGRGGSQHLHADGFISSGIQGQLVPVALGVAFAKKLRGEDGIAVVFIGDGTLGQGALYESMNLASLWGVRLLLVLEDNAIAQTTPSSVGVAGDMLARAEAFGIDAARLDGADAPALQREFATLVETMRTREAPAFRVVRTVRLGPHSKRDDDRSPDEMAELRTRDPVIRLAATLDQADVEQADRDATERIAAALDAAEASPEPDQLSHLGDVYPQLDDGAAAGPWARPAEEPRVVESLNQALHDLLERDPDVHVFGQDLFDPYGGAFAVTKGVSSRFLRTLYSTSAVTTR